MPSRAMLRFRITDEELIHCAACERRIDRALHRLPGVETVQASAQSQQIAVTIDPDQVSPEQVQTRLEQMGYQVLSAGTH